MPTPDALVGFATADLRFDRLLGRGGMGSVYLGHQIRVDRMVAIKVVKPDLAADLGYIERFTREARTMGRLIHPNVVTCHDFGVITGPDGTPLTVMVLEFVDGTSLGALVGGTPVPVRDLLDHYRQACEGLAAAHGLGIIHRDIKPDNIMLTRAGIAKLADFGLARADDSNSLTQTGAILGSPAYMSPEASLGKVPGPAGDVYGMGCSLFHSLSGRPPFLGASAIQVLHAHLSNEAPLLSSRRPDLGILDGLLARCLAKPPEHRPTAAALARELSRVALRIPPSVLAGIQADPMPVPTISREAPRPVLRHRPASRRDPERRKLLILGGIVVLLLGVIVVTAARRLPAAATTPAPIALPAPSPQPPAVPAQRTVQPVIIQGALLPAGHQAAAPGAPAKPGQAPEIRLSQLGSIRIRVPEGGGRLALILHPGASDQPRRILVGPSGIELVAGAWQLGTVTIPADLADVPITAPDQAPFLLAACAWGGKDTGEVWSRLAVHASALVSPDVDPLRTLCGRSKRGGFDLPTLGNTRTIAASGVRHLLGPGLDGIVAEAFAGGDAGSAVPVQETPDVRGAIDQAVRDGVRWCLVVFDRGQTPSGRLIPDTFVPIITQLVERGLLVIPMLGRAPAGHAGNSIAWATWFEEVHRRLPGLPIIDLQAVDAFHQRSGLPTPDAATLDAGLGVALSDLRARIASAIRTHR